MILKEENSKKDEYDAYKYLIFEGDFLKGKKHGFGKEYNNRKLIFEGEYLDGLKNGKEKIIMILDS